MTTGNTRLAGPSHSLREGGILASDWHPVGGGEAGHVVAEPQDPDVVWAGEYLGILTRWDGRTGQAPQVGVYPDNFSGHGAADMRYRFQWTAPILASRHQPGLVYHAGNVLFRTRDGGQSWEVASPDLTRDDREKQKWSGGPITGDNTGVEVYDTIFAVAESPVEQGVLWAGSDDGLVHLSRDDGASWTDVTAAMPGLPEWGTVAMIEPSHSDAGRAWVVVEAHRLDDMRPYLWETADYGRSWRRLDGGLPASSRIVLVSGRASFELVQKAAVAGIPIFCAVSAPSTLAVDAARRLGMTLVGFLRGRTFNVYAHPERVELGEPAS